MPVIGSDSEILKEYLGTNDQGRIYLGSNLVQNGDIPIVSTPYYWWDPSVTAFSTTWTSSAAGINDTGYLVMNSNEVIYTASPIANYRFVEDENVSGIHSPGFNNNTLSNLYTFGSGNTPERTWQFWVNINNDDYSNSDGKSNLIANRFLGLGGGTNYSIDVADVGGIKGIYFAGDGIVKDSDAGRISYSGSNEWINIAYTINEFDPTPPGAQVIIKSYFNGVLISEGIENINLKDVAINCLMLGIVYNGDANPRLFGSKSSIGDILFYTSSLSNGEILQNYQATVGKYS
jgi:hypothetical protein